MKQKSIANTFITNQTIHQIFQIKRFSYFGFDYEFKILFNIYKLLDRLNSYSFLWLKNFGMKIVQIRNIQQYTN